MNLFVWEANLLDDLMGAMNSIQITNAQDIWFWVHDSIRIFFVKSTYSVVKLASWVGVVLLPDLSWLKCENLADHSK
jgi:hypothetical protein